MTTSLFAQSATHQPQTRRVTAGANFTPTLLPNLTLQVTDILL